MAITLTAGINATQEDVPLSAALTAVPGDLFKLGNEVVQFGGYGRRADNARLPDHSRKRVIFHRGEGGTAGAAHLSGVTLFGTSDALVAGANENEPSPFPAAASSFPLTADVSAAGFTIGNLGDPVADGDAASKGYVDENGLPPQWTFPDATGRVLLNLDSSGGSAQDGVSIVADELPSDTVDLFTIRVPAVLPDTGEYQVFNVASDGSVEHKLANGQSTAVLIDDVLIATGGSFYLLQVVGRTDRPGKFVAQIGEGSDPVSKGFKVGSGGFIIAKHNAAPADGDLSAGDVALWLDQTNGAAKLKIKGKSANGTVVTGEVALT